MIFARNESEIIERESYIVVKTLKNPGFHWGNYLIFKKAPGPSDIAIWKKIFKKEMDHYNEFKHYVFAWDEPTPPESPEYLSLGFTLEESVSLKATELIYPKHYNSKVEIRTLKSDKDWDEAIELQIMTRDPKYGYNEYKEFKTKQTDSYKKLVSQNRGSHFGAYLNGKLVADLGIYHEDGLARYQNVGTHEDFRRQGICATLVYESGKYAMENWRVDALAMEADPEYHAAKIYESVGFTPVEKSYSLYWYIGNN